MSVSAALVPDDDERVLPTFDQPAPKDWPGPGPIDLDVHDLPHASSTLEWWYVNTHLKTESGRELALFAAFFRQARGKNADGAWEYSHSVTWALSDPKGRRYQPKVAVDASAPALGLAKLDAAGGLEDWRIERALREVLERGSIPGPTRLFMNLPIVAERCLSLDFGGDRLSKNASGEYVLHLHDATERIDCRLVLTPRKPPTRYGNDGVVHGVADERMFYYFIPRCDVRGTLTLEGRSERIVVGQGWYDHEFGFSPSPPRDSDTAVRRKGGETSWRWLSLQLDDGTDVSVFRIERRRTGEVLDDWTLVVDAAGARRQFPDARLETTGTWRSTRSFVEYPIDFRLDVPSAGLFLEVKAEFPDQEVLTVISDPGFWEGRVDVRGTLNGRPVSGKGWVECKGFRFDDVGAFFEAVGGEVRKRVAELLSTQPSRGQLANWVVRGDAGGRDTGSYVDGVGHEDMVASLVKPIREIVDRGGKGWRSYAALACIDVVGGDSRKFLHWLPIPELLHVGSLIIDDVEDASLVRRGGPSCHELFGVPLAVNAGTAAYFLAEPPVTKDDLPAESQLRVYRLYFDAMRAGHAGQAIDLHGFEHLAADAVRSGDVGALESRVLAMHRLKTAVPAGMLARIGAILGGGTEQQIEALGRFFESVGLAFQIMDDVLNLRGFKGDLKQRGEDIAQGKITFPVVKGLALATRPEREWLWSTLCAKPDDAVVVARVIGTLEESGALAACEGLARRLVDEAWERVDPILPESQFKVMFRAFSWYVLDRHY
jgi:geranylgeranyl pyrophosphate synthase/predicted secreted hydrolase